jgi:hypothetical protein
MHDANTIKDILKIRRRQGMCNCSGCLGDLRREKFKVIVIDLLKGRKIPLHFDIWDNTNTYLSRDMNYRHSFYDKAAYVLNGIERLDKDNEKRIGDSYCHICGVKHILNAEKMLLKDNKLYPVCESCIEYLSLCSDCGHYKDTRSTYSVHILIDNEEVHKLICKDCYSAYSQCYKCSITVAKENMVEFEYYSQDLYPDMDEDNRIRHLCKTCHEDNKMQCGICGKFMYRFMSKHSIRLNKQICGFCYEMQKPVHGNQFKPSTILKKTKVITPREDKLLFGIELEIEMGNKRGILNKEEMATALLDKFGRDFIYNKHDGSLRDRGHMGFEVVSHPFSWNVYKDNKEKWDKMLSFIRSGGWTSYKSGNAGIHIHMSKGAFTSFQLYKFLQFIYDEENRNFIVGIAQREPNEYCVFDERDRSSLPQVVKEKKNQDPEFCKARHAAVSLMYTPTVEVRVFRGTLKTSSFHKNFEFCKALYEFTKSMPLNYMKADTFCEYLNENKNSKPYRNLIDFIVKGRLTNQKLINQLKGA